MSRHRSSCRARRNESTTTQPGRILDGAHGAICEHRLARRDAVSSKAEQMTTPAARDVVIQLIGFAQNTTGEELQARIDDVIDLAERNLVHALVQIIVGSIANGGGDKWNKIVAQLALKGDG